MPHTGKVCIFGQDALDLRQGGAMPAMLEQARGGTHTEHALHGFPRGERGHGTAAGGEGGKERPPSAKTYGGATRRRTPLQYRLRKPALRMPIRLDAHMAGCPHDGCP